MTERGKIMYIIRGNAAEMRKFFNEVEGILSELELSNIEKRVKALPHLPTDAVNLTICDLYDYIYALKKDDMVSINIIVKRIKRRISTSRCR